MARLPHQAASVTACAPRLGTACAAPHPFLVKSEALAHPPSPHTPPLPLILADRCHVGHFILPEHSTASMIRKGTRGHRIAAEPHRTVIHGREASICSSA